MEDVLINILSSLSDIKLQLLANRKDLGEQEYNNLNRNVVSMQKIISDKLK